jgi:hypothetical protein
MATGVMMTVFWDVATCNLVGVYSCSNGSCIIRAITYRPDDGGGTPETSVNVYQTTRRNIPEDSHLQLKVLITVNLASVAARLIFFFCQNV